MQLAAPDHLRGRVIGLYFYAFNGTGAIAGILTGWLCDVGGTELAFVVAGTHRHRRGVRDRAGARLDAAPHDAPPRRPAAARVIRSPGAREDRPCTVERGGSGVSHRDHGSCAGGRRDRAPLASENSMRAVMLTAALRAGVDGAGHDGSGASGPEARACPKTEPPRSGHPALLSHQSPAHVQPADPPSAVRIWRGVRFGIWAGQRDPGTGSRWSSTRTM